VADTNGSAPQPAGHHLGAGFRNGQGGVIDAEAFGFSVTEPQNT
jgi:hypothetical protein